MRRLGEKLGTIVSTDTNARLTTDTFDQDIVLLAENINRMLERERQGLLEKARSEADLKRAITNISHDLRTPVTSALGYLQMLESGAGSLDEGTRMRYLETAIGRLEVLSGLMDDLFAFAHIIEGNLGATLQKTNIGDLLRDALSVRYAELEAKGFAVSVDIPDAPVFCLCDEDALRRVLQNLLQNVCVHGKEALRVSLSETTIEVANKADGLSRLDIGHIFERFYTADAARTGKGAGLGLAIAEGLVKAMEGQITAGVEGDMLAIRVTLPPYREPRPRGL